MYGRKRGETMPLLKVGLIATSSMHETIDKKGSIIIDQLVLGSALFQFNATTQSAT
jgi:hypothetical protein